MKQRRSLLIVLLSALLGACALHTGQTWTNYTLQPPQQNVRERKTVPLSLQVVAVDAPDWLNSRDMYYRLDYSNRNRISAYSRSRWLASPPAMLTNLLVDHLSGSGLWGAVLGPGSGVFPDYSLHLHLTAFQQVFKSPERSYGIVAARASLIDGHRDLVVAQTNFRFQVAARTGDAQGGAAALNKASDELVGAVESWLKRIPPIRREHAAPGETN